MFFCGRKKMKRKFANWIEPYNALLGKFSMPIGFMAYVISGIQDFWLLQDENIKSAWIIRIGYAGISLFVYYLAFYGAMKNYRKLLAPLLVTGAGLSFLCIIFIIPDNLVMHYYPFFVFIIFWSYYFSGIDLVSAIVIDVIFVLLFNLIVYKPEHSLQNLLLQNYYLFFANFVGIFANYVKIQNRKVLYRQEHLFVLEKRRHARASLHDRLTGLPNRDLMEDRLRVVLDSRNIKLSAAIYIDLDDFKIINEQHGHKAGDIVLKEIAMRLENLMRSEDTISRIGADEFFIIAVNIKDIKNIDKISNKIIGQLKKPVRYETYDLLTAGTLAVVPFVYKECSIEEIWNEIDKAMYIAKEKNKGSYLVNKIQHEH